MLVVCRVRPRDVASSTGSSGVATPCSLLCATCSLFRGVCPLSIWTTVLVYKLEVHERLLLYFCSYSLSVSSVSLDMVFLPPAWAPKLTDAEIPDSIPLGEFLFNDNYRPRKCGDSPAPFVDSITRKGYGIHETRQRVELLAAGLARELDIKDTCGNPLERVVGIFTVNNVSSHKSHSRACS